MLGVGLVLARRCGQRASRWWWALSSGAALSLACVEPAGAEPRVRNQAAPVASRFVLRNGLAVYLEEDHRQPLVALRMSYAIGSRDDPKRASGLAHLAEHLTFSGSRHLKDGGLPSLLQSAGASDWNGQVAEDTSEYQATFSSGALALGLWLERERMAFTAEHLEQASLRAEKEMLKREGQTRLGTEGPLYQALLNAMFGRAHPYASAIDGDSELSGVTLDEVRAFLSNGYRPDHARLILIGDFESRVARDLIERYFGSIQNPAGAPLRASIQAAKIAGVAHSRYQRGALRQSVILGYRLPGDSLRERAQRDLFFALLEHDWEKSTERGDQRLFALHASETRLELGSVCVINATLAEQTTADQGALAMHDAIARLATSEGTKDLERVRRRLTVAWLRRWEEVGARAELQAELWGEFGQPIRSEDYVRELNGVSARELSAISHSLILSPPTRVDTASAEEMERDGAPATP